MSELIFRIALGVLLLSFGGIKLSKTNKYVKSEEHGNRYPPSINFILAVAAIFIVFMPFLHILTLLDGLSVNIKPIFRYFGILLFILSILLMYWQMNTLDLNISTVHEDRFLVTSGPYQYIRHPLYAIFIMVSIAEFLITSIWLIGVGIPIVILAMLIRIQYEEKILLEEYGEEYFAYTLNSKKLIPLLY